MLEQVCSSLVHSADLEGFASYHFGASGAQDPGEVELWCVWCGQWCWDTPLGAGGGGATIAAGGGFTAAGTV